MERPTGFFVVVGSEVDERLQLVAVPNEVVTA